jgi:hypothetical protein
MGRMIEPIHKISVQRRLGVDMRVLLVKMLAIDLSRRWLAAGPPLERL